MKLFYSQDQHAHAPRQYMVHGRLVAPFEAPDRLAVLAEALAGAGWSREIPPEADREALLAVHDAGYLTYLETAWERWQTLPDRGPEVLPNAHPYGGAGRDQARRGPPPTRGIIGQTGWYIGDLSCAIMAGTWRAVHASAAAAIAAADTVLGGAPVAFALCRPPGHHAYPDRAGGFCFLNNAALAAERLRRGYERVAIIDFDTHHGDGTQAIFYHRDDVFYGSVHTDPAVYYPHFAGYADERGTGAGLGTTLNLPLAPRSDGGAFVERILTLAEAVQDYRAGALVISAGWDAHRDDPLSRLDIGFESYSRAGDVLGALDLPTVIVQEGGYALPVLMRAAPDFTAAFLGRHRCAGGA